MSHDLAGRRIGLLTAWASRQNGGVFEAVAAQVAMLRALGAEVAVFSLASEHDAADAERLAGAELLTLPVRGPGQIGFTPGLIPALLGARLDCLHLHGIWMYPSHAGAAWARTTGRPYLVSPHGMLDPWITARGRWKKALARLGYERAGWRAAHAFHALTAREAEDIARESGRRDSLVIPNAGPPALPPPTAPRAPELLYIGRIHAKKNLLALVDGWRQAHRPEDARLVIAGWGDAADVAALEQRIGAPQGAAGPGGVTFVGPQFGAQKAALLARARFTVLPSLSEGLPMAVLDGWAAGVPALISRECNLPEGLAAGAALPCADDPAGIARTIEAALALNDAQWLDMARAAQALAAGRFSAAAVAQQWAAAYATAIAARPGKDAA
jgi:poly(glycerol-phosphate) alpha-glucosyltransferase